MNNNRRNWNQISILIFSAGLLIFFSKLCLAGVPDVGPEKCSVCDDNGNCRPVSCEDSGGGSPSYTPYRAPVPAGPTAEQLKQQREAKDLQDASLDANDAGVEAYESGDYASAVKYLEAALEDDPDNEQTQSNLDKARAALRQSETTRKLKSAEYHGRIAQDAENPEERNTQAQKVFDIGGENRGTLEIPAVNAGNGGYKDPVVPPSKRTKEITQMESKRETLKQIINRLEETRKTLDPQKDAVQISEIKQKQSDHANEIHMLDFSITEELRKAPEPGSEPTTSAR